MTAAMILAASCSGAKGAGLHVSPQLVAQAVDLAELLEAELERRAVAEEILRSPPLQPAVAPPTTIIGTVTVNGDPVAPVKP